MVPNRTVKTHAQIQPLTELEQRFPGSSVELEFLNHPENIGGQEKLEIDPFVPQNASGCSKFPGKAWPRIRGPIWRTPQSGLGSVDHRQGSSRASAPTLP